MCPQHYFIPNKRNMIFYSCVPSDKSNVDGTHNMKICVYDYYLLLQIVVARTLFFAPFNSLYFRFCFRSNRWVNGPNETYAIYDHPQSV